MMAAVIQIREETEADYEAVFAVNFRAFGREDEARLVEALRAEGAAIVSLVAVDDGDIVGHILFTRLEVGTVASAALAPVAVDPDRQREGIGAMLITRGLDLCRERGVEAVVVLGHRDYYPRFGFSPELALNLEAPFGGAEFMALELVEGSLAGVRAPVRYAKAFDLPPGFTRA